MAEGFFVQLVSKHRPPAKPNNNCWHLVFTKNRLQRVEIIPNVTSSSCGEVCVLGEFCNRVLRNRVFQKKRWETPQKFCHLTPLNKLPLQTAIEGKK